MECIDIGSKIITIVTMIHGEIINLNLSPDNQRILDNTRLFSLSGDFTSTGFGDNSVKTNHLEYLNTIFRHDLPDSTYQSMEQFTERVRPAYANYIKAFLDDLTTENICKVYQTITIDKAFGTEINGIFAIIMNCILPDVIGIYVVSVHEKVDANNIKLVYPMNKYMRNLNLLNHTDFIQFADIFGQNGKNILRGMIELSSQLPIYNTRTDDDTFKEQLKTWNVTCSQKGDISNIRLSYLIGIIKQIVGREKCKLNIFDYSCSNISPAISEREKQLYSKYMIPSDIESGTDKTWGGKSIHKKRRTRKRR